MELETAKAILMHSLSEQDDLERAALETILNALEMSKADSRVTYSEDGTYAYFQGREYHKTKDGYYQRKLELHVAVMEAHIGSAIPKGCHVHHNGKDAEGNFDKSKNDIENLLLLTQSEHRRLHNVLDKGAERTVICASCGQEFKTRDKQRLYCTEKCRRKNERKRVKEFICQICGKKFFAPRGSKRKLCNEHTTKKCKLIIPE